MTATVDSTRPTPSTPDAWLTSGSSPGRTRIHLHGPGKVGRALLGLLRAADHRLIAVTDSERTVHCPNGFEPRRVRDIKFRDGSLAGVAATVSEVGNSPVNADLVIDATPSDPVAAIGAVARGWAALAAGAGLVLASKHALSRVPHEWLRPELRDRIGCNAVLGGTGLQFQDELPELRRDCVAVSISGNATSTLIIQAIEHGASLEQGVAAAAELGVLEPDPELDFRGEDAAVKLAIVSGALEGRALDPTVIPRTDLRDLDPAELRRRRAQGSTTRLIGNRNPDGSLRLVYEEVPASSPLATRTGQVVYAYRLRDGHWRHHVGYGIGPLGTAQALLADVERLSGAASTRERGNR
jgi:homoserine dehydrogenase